MLVVSRESLVQQGYNSTQILKNIIDKEDIAINMQIDLNGMLMKTDQYIKYYVPSLNIQEGQKIYLTVYKFPYVDNSYEVDLEVNFYDQNFCYQECQGTCIDAYDYACKCDTNDVFGYFCEKSYKKIEINKPEKNHKLKQNDWTYFYSQISDKNKSVNIFVTKEVGYNLGISLFFPQTSSFEYPNFEENHYTIPLDSVNNTFTIPVDFLKENVIVQNQDSGEIIIGFYSYDTNEDQKISLAIYENPDVEQEMEGNLPTWALFMFTALAICGIVFMIVVICAIVKGGMNYDRRHHRIIRISPMTEQKLTPDVINQYLPEILYKDIVQEQQNDKDIANISKNLIAQNSQILRLEKVEEEQKSQNNNDQQQKSQNNNDNSQDNKNQNQEKIQENQQKIKIPKLSEIPEECPICLVEFEQEDLCRITLCQHLFHKECIDSWLKNHKNCPNCRREHKLDNLKESKQVVNEQNQDNQNQSISGSENQSGSQDQHSNQQGSQVIGNNIQNTSQNTNTNTNNNSNIGQDNNNSNQMDEQIQEQNIGQIIQQHGQVLGRQISNEDYIQENGQQSSMREKDENTNFMEQIVQNNQPVNNSQNNNNNLDIDFNNLGDQQQIAINLTDRLKNKKNNKQNNQNNKFNLNDINNSSRNNENDINNNSILQIQGGEIQQTDNNIEMLDNSIEN